MPRTSPRKRITIRDVAHAAGASRGVVSSVLNGNRHKTTRVSEETQERIRQAAATLGYRPNALARSLQQRRTHNLLLASYYVSPLLGPGGFFVEVLDGALSAATRRGYDLMIHLVHPDDPDKVAVLGDGRADGCLWIGPNSGDPVLPRLADERDWPLVLFGGRFPGATANVIADNPAGMELAVEHLYALGHRRLAFVNQSTLSYECVERWEAFAAACARRGIVPRQITAAQTPPDENGRTEVRRESLRGPLSDPATRPTGVVAFNDALAAQLMRCASEAGLRVPDDLSVVGVDSTPFCETLSPPLTSLRQPLREMAERCVEILIAEIGAVEGDPGDGTTAGTGTELFPYALDVRASTGPLPAIDTP